MQICIQCHRESIRTKDGRVLPAVGEQIAEGKYLHGPIRQQDCTPCHAAHGSDDPRLMKAPFPRDFYVPYSKDAYALCFGCHNPEMVEKPRSRTTGFRDGDRNLHYLHVHQEKGRSCRACHAEHASNNPFHIRDWVPFGQWKLTIQFQKTPEGGACLAGCHIPRSYDRDHPVNGPLNMDLSTEGFSVHAKP
jgi:predicted CXXCH cytochrome family protein